MSQNVGTIDRAVRMLIAASVAVMFILGTVQGPLAAAFAVLGFAMFATAIIGWCPLYAMLKVSTLNRRGSRLN